MSKASKWKVEKAPSTIGRKNVRRRELLEALIKLAKDGGAIRLDSAKDGASQHVRQSLHNLSKRRGYNFHAQATTADGSYLVWVSPSEETTP